MRNSHPKRLSGPVTASLVLIGSLFVSGSASAQIYDFTSDSAYQDASFSIVDAITFNGQPVSQSSYTDFGNPGNDNVGGVDFTTNAGTNLYAIGPKDVGAFNTSYNVMGDGTSTLDAQGSLQPNGPGAFSNGVVVLDATLPPGTTAAGTEIGSAFIGAPISVTVTLINPSTQALSTQTFTFPAASAGAVADGLGFLGFVSAGDPIYSIAYTDTTADLTGTPTLTIDNFTYGVIDTAGLTGNGGGGDPLPTPEPSTYAMIVIAAVSLFYFRRRLSFVL